MIDSAFALDEQRRRQQDAEAKLRTSIGIQNKEGEQIHWHNRTEVARSYRDELKAVARDTRAHLSDDQKQDNTSEREAKRRGDVMRVAINAPHRATVRGNQIALTIRAGDQPGGGADSTTVLTPLKLVTASVAGKLRVVYGTIQGGPITGMSAGDVPPFEFTPVGSSGVVYAVLTLRSDFSGFSARTISSGASVPTNSTSTIYLEIGSYATVAGAFVPAFALSGSVAASICGSATSEVPVVTWEGI